MPHLSRAASIIGFALTALGVQPARAEDRCYPAGGIVNLQDLGFLDEVTTSPGGAFLVVQGNADEFAVVYALPDGRPIRIHKPARTRLRVLDDKEVVFDAGGHVTAVDARSGASRDMIAPLPPEHGVALALSRDIEGRFRIAKTPTRGSGASKAAGSTAALQVVTINSLCADAAAAVADDDRSHVARLTGFARPGGFRDREDLEVFLAIAKSGEAPPEFVAAALLGILHRSEQLFKALVDDLRPEMSRYDVSFLTAAERAEIGLHVKKYVQRAFRSDENTQFESLGKYAPLVRLFFGETEKRDLMELVGYRAAEDAKTMPEFSAVDPYKVFAFAYGEAGKLFASTDFVEFTDLSVSRSAGGLTFALFGTSPVEDARRNVFGFYMKNLATWPAVFAEDRKSFERTWDHNGKHYRASITLHRAPPRRPGAASKAFPAGAARGVVLVSGNMEAELVHETLAQYRSYYEGAGFRFDPPRRRPNVPRALAASFSGKQPGADYLIKEAHADADEDNILTTTRRGFSIVGRKIDTGESVEIFYPRGGKAKLRGVSNSEFSSWSRAHAAATSRALVFVDASCWSYVKISAATSRLDGAELIGIGTLGPTGTMSATSESAARTLLEGIRKAESFETVRQSLKQQAGYASGVEDAFVFPDEDRFSDLFGGQGGEQVSVDRALFVRDKHGRETKYTPDGY